MTGKYDIEIYNKRVHYHLTVKRNITVIQGDSATGKTELLRMISAKMQKNCCSNLPDFQRHSHTREKNSHLIFHLDMQNIPHLQPAVHSLCAVQMQPFMK